MAYLCSAKRLVFVYPSDELQCNSFLSEVERREYRPSLPAHPERRRRCRGIAPAECLEQTGVEFSKGSNEGGAQSMARRFGRTTSTKSKGGAYGKGVGLGISVLLALVVISLAVWLLRRSARDESTPATPEPGEGVEAGLEEEEAAVVGEASTPGEAGEQEDKAQATPAAERKAEELGVDLSQIEGTGSGGRITVKDVREAANQARP